MMSASGDLDLKHTTIAAERHDALKACSKCNLQKHVACFSRNRARPDGLCMYCKPCNAASAAERRRVRVPVNDPTVTHKVCGQCRRDLPAGNYHRSKSYKDGITGKCKECCASAISQRKADRELEGARRNSETSIDSRQLVGGLNYSFVPQDDLAHQRSFASSGTLIYGDGDILPLSELGSQVLGDGPRVAHWGDGGGAAKRQRAEVPTCVGSFWECACTPLYGHGALVGQTFGGQQQQQQQSPPDRGLSLALGAFMADEGDCALQVPTIGFRGHTRVVFAAHAPFEASAETAAAAVISPVVPNPMRFPLLGPMGISTPDCPSHAASNSAERRVPALGMDHQGVSTLMDPYRPITCTPALTQPAIGQLLASGTGAEVFTSLHAPLVGGWAPCAPAPCLPALGVDTPMLESDRLARSSLTTMDAMMATGDAVLASDRVFGAQGIDASRRDPYFKVVRPARAYKTSKKELRARHGRHQAQGAPILGTYTFQDALDLLHKRQQERYVEEWQLTTGPPAMPSRASFEQGSTEMLHAFDLQQVCAGETALQRLLGGSVPAMVLSVEAAAAFPSLACRFAAYRNY